LKKYKHIFFDLDRTLWDFEKNSSEALSEIFCEFKLEEKSIPSSEEFISVYQKINDEMWDDYRNGHISKKVLRSERYDKTLQYFGVENQELAERIGCHYIAESPKKTHLFPFAHETLSYLKEKYSLHIITNGFEEVQHIKLLHSNLMQYFTEVITSEQAGYKKPAKEIFEFALQKANAKPSESLMIGDDLQVDILPAKAMGMRQVYFNPEKQNHSEKIDFVICSLDELTEIL